MHHQKVPRIIAFKHSQACCHLKHEELECKQQRCNEASNILWQYNAEFNHQQHQPFQISLFQYYIFVTRSERWNVTITNVHFSFLRFLALFYISHKRKKNQSSIWSNVALQLILEKFTRKLVSLGMWFPTNQYFLLTSWKHWDLLKYRFGLVRMRNAFVFEVINIHLEKTRESLHIRCRKFIQIYKVSHLSFIHINVLQHTAHWPRQLYIKLE